METTLAILMVLGIYVGIPALIDLTVASAYVLTGRRIQKVERHAETAAHAQVQTA